MELYPMLGASLDRRGVWGRMGTFICKTESLHCLPETTTAVLTLYTPQYKIKV